MAKAHGQQGAKSAAVQAKFERAVSCLQQSKLKEAERAFADVLRLAPDHYDALLLSGIVALQAREIERGVAFMQRAIAVEPGIADAHSNLGGALLTLKRPAEALESFDRSIALKPDWIAEDYGHRGKALLELKRPEEALSSFDQAIALNPGHADVYSNRGNALRALNRLADALDSYERALAMKPDLAEAWLGRGNCLSEMKRYDEALIAYDRVAALRPDFPEAWVGRGEALNKLKRHGESAEAFAKALALAPQHPLAKGSLLHQKMLACDWDGIDALIAEVEADIAAGRLSADPFGWQGIATSSKSLQRCAEIYSAQLYPPAEHAPTRNARYDHARIRIGYLSGEFREQATAYLIVGLLEQHDKSRFEIVAVDNGRDDGGPTRKRINAAVDGALDIAAMSDAEAAAAIRAREIDILVNLNGYFGDGRTGVFARRAAPLQVNYLGFPGTLGAPYLDYIVADDIVIPPGERAFYTEKVVYLPESYQANDDKRPIATDAVSRAAHGLPEQGFVFCCFNNNYKIMPGSFAQWMRVLGQVPGSVLWLIDSNAEATANLRREAAKAGVAPERLVFAKQMPLARHLARHRAADLFLDTLPYNAHTTASDALWAGLPVLTCPGTTFAGRVAASLLEAIGLPELIAPAPEAYEALAVALATQPDKLAAIKRKLAANRLTAPLFDTRRFTRHLEAAYTAMLERHRAGLPPEHCALAKTPSESSP